MKHLALAIVVFTLAACGGGGGGGGGDDFVPTDPNTVFQTFPPGYFTTGYSDTVNYTGTDSRGDVYTFTGSVQTQAQTTFLGEPAIPLLAQVQITNTSTGGFASNTGTTYYSTSASDRRHLGYSDSSETTVSATTFAIPQTATIGDFGVVGTYTNNAGEVDDQSVRLDDGGNGRAKLVILSTKRDQFGALLISSTSTTLIDTSGNPISGKIEIFYADIGVTLTLTGS